jgi:hypothetical protein
MQADKTNHSWVNLQTILMSKPMSMLTWGKILYPDIKKQADTYHRMWLNKHHFLHILCWRYLDKFCHQSPLHMTPWFLGWPLQCHPNGHLCLPPATLNVCTSLSAECSGELHKFQNSNTNSKTWINRAAYSQEKRYILINSEYFQLKSTWV